MFNNDRLEEKLDEWLSSGLESLEKAFESKDLLKIDELSSKALETYKRVQQDFPCLETSNPSAVNALGLKLLGLKTRLSKVEGYREHIRQRSTDEKGIGNLTKNRLVTKTAYLFNIYTNKELWQFDEALDLLEKKLSNKRHEIKNLQRGVVDIEKLSTFLETGLKVPSHLRGPVSDRHERLKAEKEALIDQLKTYNELSSLKPKELEGLININKKSSREIIQIGEILHDALKKDDPDHDKKMIKDVWCRSGLLSLEKRLLDLKKKSRSKLNDFLAERDPKKIRNGHHDVENFLYIAYGEASGIALKATFEEFSDYYRKEGKIDQKKAIETLGNILAQCEIGDKNVLSLSELIPSNEALRTKVEDERLRALGERLKSLKKRQDIDPIERQLVAIRYLEKARRDKKDPIPHRDLLVEIASVPRGKRPFTDSKKALEKLLGAEVLVHLEVLSFGEGLSTLEAMQGIKDLKREKGRFVSHLVNTTFVRELERLKGKNPIDEEGFSKLRKESLKLRNYLGDDSPIELNELIEHKTVEAAFWNEVTQQVDQKVDWTGKEILGYLSPFANTFKGTVPLKGTLGKKISIYLQEEVEILKQKLSGKEGDPKELLKATSLLSIQVEKFQFEKSSKIKEDLLEIGRWTGELLKNSSSITFSNLEEAYAFIRSFNIAETRESAEALFMFFQMEGSIEKLEDPTILKKFFHLPEKLYLASSRLLSEGRDEDAEKILRLGQRLLGPIGKKLSSYQSAENRLSKRLSSPSGQDKKEVKEFKPFKDIFPEVSQKMKVLASEITIRKLLNDPTFSKEDFKLDPLSNGRLPIQVLQGGEVGSDLKARHIIQETYTTEETYLESLRRADRLIEEALKTPSSEETVRRLNVLNSSLKKTITQHESFLERLSSGHEGGAITLAQALENISQAFSQTSFEEMIQSDAFLIVYSGALQDTPKASALFDLSSNKLKKPQPISSLGLRAELSAVFQRVTKYPLLLKDLLKNQSMQTGLSTAHQNSEKAVKKVNEFRRGFPLD